MRYEGSYCLLKTKLGHIKRGTIENKKEFLGIKNEISKILNSVGNLRDHVMEMSIMQNKTTKRQNKEERLEDQFRRFRAEEIIKE